jgi:CBS domain containing-hemolysin-like protein
MTPFKDIESVDLSLEEECFWDSVKASYYVGEDKKINSLLKEFQSGKTNMAFVKDKNNNIIGMLTLEEILEEDVRRGS